VFSSGTITITSGNTILFMSSLTNGTVTRHTEPGEPNDADFLASIVPSSCTGLNVPNACTGGTLDIRNLDIHGQNIRGLDISGTAHVDVVPEPGTLGMLGTGVIGLAGMMRRKLKLWM